MTEQKRSLADILGELPALQDAEVYEETIEVTDDAETIYDEVITHDMAKVILGHKYDPKCRYKLITQQEVTILVKINDAWPDDKENVLDATGNIIDGKIVEYVLEPEKSKDVQSYSDMMLHINRDVTVPITKNFYGFDENKRSRKFIVFLILFILIVVGLWVTCLVFLNTLKGGF